MTILATFSGNTILLDRHRKDTQSLFPARTGVAIMDVQNAGKWMFLCQVTDHYSGGMFTFYNAEKCDKNKGKNEPELNGKVREYFIAAEEVEWDYAPSGMNYFDGGKLNASDRLVFLTAGIIRLSSRLLNA